MPPGKTLLSTRRIQERVRVLGREIRRHYRGKPLTVLGLMNGSLFFLADLLRQLPVETRFECLPVSSYRGRKSSGKLRGHTVDFSFCRGRHILIVDDILDTGLTLNAITRKAGRAGAADVKICVLLSKKVRRRKDVEADWTGFEIENHFVVGYGLDYNGNHRNLPKVQVL